MKYINQVYDQFGLEMSRESHEMIIEYVQSISGYEKKVTPLNKKELHMSITYEVKPSIFSVDLLSCSLYP